MKKLLPAFILCFLSQAIFSLESPKFGKPRHMMYTHQP